MKKLSISQLKTVAKNCPRPSTSTEFGKITMELWFGSTPAVLKLWYVKAFLVVCEDCGRGIYFEICLHVTMYI